MKLTQLTSETAGGFYAVHKERPFFGELVEFMTSGACSNDFRKRERSFRF